MNKKLNKLLYGKQKSITHAVGYPTLNEGNDGDITIRTVPGRGVFLFVKINNKWYQSRLSRTRPVDEEGYEPVTIPLNKLPKKSGEISIHGGNLKINRGSSILSFPNWVIHQGGTTNVSPDNPIHVNNINFAGLTDLTADIVAQDELFILEYKDSGEKEHKRKQISEIKLSAFNNDSGWTTNSGTVTSVSVSDGSSSTAITTSGTFTFQSSDGLDHTESAGTVTYSLDLSELADGTDAINAAHDELIYLDKAVDTGIKTQKRKQFNEIGLSSFNNDLIVDEDNMSSNSATLMPSQQSVKAYVDSEISGLVDSAPGALDTLNELAAALNDDASFSTTVTNSIATKVSLTGDETIAGNKTFSGLVKISAGGPQLIFVDTTDDDDHKIQFWDESNNVVHIIRTSDNTGGGLGDSLCIGSVENKPLQFITQDTTRMVIDGSGNVGIGTTSPLTPLHIYSAGGSTEGLRFQNAHDIVNMNFQGNDDNEMFEITYVGTGGAEIQLQADGDLILNGSNGDNVGIGTTSPQTHLNVFHTSAPEIAITGDADNTGVLAFGDDGNYKAGRLEYNHTDNAFTMDVAASEKFKLTSSTMTADVDINITSGHELKIAGTSVLSNNTLGSGVTASSLTSVGTITSGTWQGTPIAHAYIGNDAIDGDNIADDSVNSEHYVHGSIDNLHIADTTIAFDKIATAAYQTHGQMTSPGFANNDTTFLTAKAIKTYIESYGYITATLTDEQIQDKVGAMFSSNTETGITATYEDGDGTIDLVVDDTTKLPLAGGDMTGHLQITATEAGHSGSGAYVPSGTDWQNVLRLGSTSDNGFNFLIDDAGTSKISYYTNRWGCQHEWARGSEDTGDGNTYQPVMRLTSNDSNTNLQLYDGTTNGVNVRITSESSNDTYFNNSSNNVAIGSTSAGGYKLKVTGTTHITGALTVDSTVDGRDLATDGSKLDGIADNATANAGTVTAVNVGTGLDVANNTTTPNITVDFAELPDGTADIVGGNDEIIYLDLQGDSTKDLKRKQFDEIKLSAFNEDFFRDIKIHQWYTADSNQDYIPFGGSQAESNSTADSLNDDTLFIAPYDGTLEKLVIQAAPGALATPPGNTRIALRVNGTTQTFEEESIGHETTQTFTWTSNNSFSAGDRLRISFDPAGGAPKYVTATSVWKYTL